jgi:hypothetical protein
MVTRHSPRDVCKAKATPQTGDKLELWWVISRPREPNVAQPLASFCAAANRPLGVEESEHGDQQGSA